MIAPWIVIWKYGIDAMAREKRRKFVCDFETTVYHGQETTEVWAAAAVEMHTEDVRIFHSLEGWLLYMENLKQSAIAYFHNLKFDGAFILDYLLSHPEKYHEELIEIGDGAVKWDKQGYFRKGGFSYSISDRGMWYTIVICFGNRQFLEIRDSLKLLPFSVKQIGAAFGTKARKLEMEYEGRRYAGCAITEEEKEYIANDVLVIKEALEFMEKEGNTGLTIGSCCMKEFKSIMGKQYDDLFPDLTAFRIDKDKYGEETADAFIRRSYKGGWCYLKEGYEGYTAGSGFTADVNSLYPSVMHSVSGNVYPYGKPKFWHGDYIPDEALKPNRFYYIKARTRFYLKKGRLPCIQIKNNFLYKSTKWLTTSDIETKDGSFSSEYIGTDGEVHTARPVLTFSGVDWALVKEQYELVDCEIIGGCYFAASCYLFDEYIDKWGEVKRNAPNKAIRTEAKLFLNNLYGKLASSTLSSFKTAYLDDGGIMHFTEHFEEDKKAGFIACGAAVTSYARAFTIRAAQANYDTFIYADTDSIHCEGDYRDVKGINIHESNFLCWKLEGIWDKARFIRQKTYAEHITHEDLKEVMPHWEIKCAGMQKGAKDLFLKVIERTLTKEEYAANRRDIKGVCMGYKDIEDFKIGLCVPGQLKAKRIKGGILLERGLFVLRDTK